MQSYNSMLIFRIYHKKWNFIIITFTTVPMNALCYRKVYRFLVTLFRLSTHVNNKNSIANRITFQSVINTSYSKHNDYALFKKFHELMCQANKYFALIISYRTKDHWHLKQLHIIIYNNLPIDDFTPSNEMWLMYEKIKSDFPTAFSSDNNERFPYTMFFV